MKKNILCAALAILLALTFAACGEKEEEGKKKPAGPKEDVSIWHAEGFEKSTLKNQISWEGINSIPIKKAGMDISEARQLCVDFFRYAKTCTWIPDAQYGIWADAVIHEGEKPKREMDYGVTYGGLPYISWATGSPYRLMDYIDEETGVVNMANAGDKPILFGNQCANGAYVGFARVINSAKYGITAKMLQANGFLNLGEYTYNKELPSWKKDYGTPNVLNENGRDVMMESYALLKAGDPIVYWTTAGHVVMIATDAVVVRDDKGNIDPVKSFVTIIDQAVSFVPYQHQDGDLCQIAENVDAKWNFQQLYAGKYLPMTFAEWTGEDPIEETEVSFSHQGDTITIDQLYGSTVTTNYYLFDIYAHIYNSAGIEVCKIARRYESTNTRALTFEQGAFAEEVWGSYYGLDPEEEYTVKVVAQIGTGERPVVWEGKLVV
ncbi:MAG: hypothetical protein IKA47_04340 [Oscillospiraceae bacterium]|nr:hypothetical protein [Oscillospiraceae bacterium]